MALLHCLALHNEATSLPRTNSAITQCEYTLPVAEGESAPYPRVLKRKYFVELGAGVSPLRHMIVMIIAVV